MSFRVHGEKASIPFHRVITPASQRLISRNWGCVQNGNWTSIRLCQRGQSLRATLSSVLRTLVLADYWNLKRQGYPVPNNFLLALLASCTCHRKHQQGDADVSQTVFSHPLLMHQRMPIKNFITAVWDSARLRNKQDATQMLVTSYWSWWLGLWKL